MINRQWKDFQKLNASPCMDCPTRDGDKCTFYKRTLDVVDGIGYVPCRKCDIDCGTGDLIFPNDDGKEE